MATRPEPGVPKKPRVVRRFVLLVLFGIIGVFSACCAIVAVIDYFNTPAEMGHSIAGWALLSLPVFVGLAGAVCFRKVSPWARAALSIAAALLASLIGISLYIMFAFKFGGPL